MYKTYTLKTIKILLRNIPCSNPYTNQNPKRYFIKIVKLILKFLWKYRRPKISQYDLKNKTKNVGELALPDFKIYYKATVRVYDTDIYSNEQEGVTINSLTHGQLISTKMPGKRRKRWC